MSNKPSFTLIQAAIDLEWTIPNLGFGRLTTRVENDKIFINNTHISPETCRVLLHPLVDEMLEVGEYSIPPSQIPDEPTLVIAVMRDAKRVTDWYAASDETIVVISHSFCSMAGRRRILDKYPKHVKIMYFDPDYAKQLSPEYDLPTRLEGFDTVYIIGDGKEKEAEHV